MIYFCMNELNICILSSPDVGLGVVGFGVVGFPEVETVDACVVVVLPLRFQYSIGFHFSSWYTTGQSLIKLKCISFNG